MSGLDLAEGAVCRLGANKAAVAALWTLIAGDGAGEDEAAALETWQELLNQSATGAAAALAERAGRPIRFAQTRRSEPPGPELAAVELCFRIVGDQTHRVALAFNEELALAVLELEPIATELTAVAPSEPEAKPPTELENGLQLLKELELDLAVSFGHTTMTLEETLKLASGSIVELNRAISDPVELLVNNSVIARGEVVVVDGNYGVRITEIASQRDRVKSFF